MTYLLHILILTNFYIINTISLNLIAAMIVAGAVAATTVFPPLRIHDDYFVIATFGLRMNGSLFFPCF